MRIRIRLGEHQSKRIGDRWAIMMGPVLFFCVSCGDVSIARDTPSSAAPSKQTEKWIPGFRGREDGGEGLFDHFPANMFDLEASELFDLLRSRSAEGDAIPASTIDASLETMKNMGFQKEGDDYIRRAHLDATVPSLVMTHSRTMPSIDCIVMISIFRTKEKENYIFSTLENMFRVFPEDSHFNILVGDDRASYLDRDRLENIFGKANSARLHVWATSPEDASFLAANLDIKRRAGWNYARAMRSYAGHRGLLLLEDDIMWCKNAVEHINQWTAQDHPAVLSLYTRKNYLRLSKPILGHLVAMHMGNQTPRFEGTQALYMSSKVSHHLGDFMQIRLHETAYDWNVDAFLRKYDILMGYAFPSLVQHTGLKSSGLGCYHESDCFSSEY